MTYITSIKDNLKKNKLLLLTILLFFSPFFIDYGFKAQISQISFSLPHITSGDEPHYMAFMSSIIKDLDLDVKNNYENAIKGYGDAGFNLRYGNIVYHHSVLVDKENNMIYTLDEFYDITDPLLPRLKEKENADLSNFKEISVRYIGLPFFGSIFLWPFRNSLSLDSAAILLSAIVSLIGFYFLYLILVYFRNDKRLAWVVVTIFMFATQLWYYAKTFYPDPYMASLLIISYYFFIVKKRIFISSILLGGAVLMKYSAIIFPVAFVFWMLKDKKFKESILFCAPIIISMLMVFLYNFIAYGDPLFFHIRYQYGDIISGFIGLLFSLEHGLLIFTPFLIFSFFGFYNFYKEEKDKAIFTLFIFFTYMLFISSGVFWQGGASYATRLLIPIMPLLAIPLLIWYSSSKNKYLKKIFFILVFVSFIISLYSVFAEVGNTLSKPLLFPYINL